MQLQSFLFDEYVPQETYNSRNSNKTIANPITEKERELVIDNCRNFTCNHCGFNVKFQAVNDMEVNKQVGTAFNKKQVAVVTAAKKFAEINDMSHEETRRLEQGMKEKLYVKFIGIFLF